MSPFCRKATAICGFLVLIALMSERSAFAEADNQAVALKEIRDTANDICYTIQQEGRQSEKQISGDVTAKLAGVISRLADLGINGAGQLKDQSYQGVLREQLASALKNSADCKKDVFDKLVDKLLPSSSSIRPTQQTIRVVDSLLRAQPNEYEGDCPVKITFDGRVSVVGGAGSVAYKFERSDYANGPVQVLKFDAPGSYDVKETWSIGGPGMSYAGWEAIKILDPNSMESPKAPFKISCTAAPPANVASVNINRASCSTIGTGSYRIELGGEVVAPENSSFSAAASPIRGSNKNDRRITCPGWSVTALQCQRRAGEPEHVKWDTVELFYDQGDNRPYMATATLYNAGSSAVLASAVVSNLVCR